jgi:hypothetical protein
MAFWGGGGIGEWQIKTSITVLTKIYLPLPTSVQPISITKTLLIVLTKNERDPPFFTGKLLIKFQKFLSYYYGFLGWRRRGAAVKGR